MWPPEATALGLVEAISLRGADGAGKLLFLGVAAHPMRAA
jgi:hypothetical protein